MPTSRLESLATGSTPLPLRGVVDALSFQVEQPVLIAASSSPSIIVLSIVVGLLALILVHVLSTPARSPICNTIVLLLVAPLESFTSPSMEALILLLILLGSSHHLLILAARKSRAAQSPSLPTNVTWPSLRFYRPQSLSAEHFFPR
jgi:hypothetical protein